MNKNNDDKLNIIFEIRINFYIPIQFFYPEKHPGDRNLYGHIYLFFELNRMGKKSSYSNLFNLNKFKFN